ncbi:glyoxylase-like metal-dependent hydrolase (beta-lactamase superfamily II) [Paenibacillus forsythiae]|uniref:Glyoxylase-like metal-dependent hydrolase (Beta-lactamase superfamily II) n=1 Tax=Paenibacillus forsythiae TaxID=365616 RepID=A0ABU3H670_9BACL|nr:MBL fold metallo-hydrolase [Paenibacillus forsythiae]MDT3425552.1 glyoxylase-like metal-dependent hydrolase (beta-lactamase superfamily II) [Paenibacillus forsythiae]
MEKTYELYTYKAGHSTHYNYIYVIVDRTSKQAIIVDPAWEKKLIARMLEELRVELTTILLTHSHNDHVNEAEALARMYNARVYMSAREISYYGYRCTNLHSFEDGKTIPVGDTLVTCLLTPGHTVGSACFLLPGSLFTGDTIFIEGCGVCHFPGGSPESMYESVQRIKNTISPDIRIYPGHSYGKEPGLPFSYLLQYNIYFQFDESEQFIRFRMRKNQKFWPLRESPEGGRFR